mmetsp:Transcript_32519/g.74303  ORF Transcript_32519/g.74303 Transcript_32519/m.74303 type:complete len:89 (-) Transcript_32519:89-355(-)
MLRLGAVSSSSKALEEAKVEVGMTKAAKAKGVAAAIVEAPVGIATVAVAENEAGAEAGGDGISGEGAVAAAGDCTTAFSDCCAVFRVA